MGDDGHFRRTARQPLELRVSFRRDEDNAPLRRSGQLIDLGMGGARIRCERPPAPGERVQVTLSSPSAWDPLELSAQVRWADAKDNIFGVSFEAPGRAEAAALYHLLAAVRFEREVDAEPTAATESET